VLNIDLWAILKVLIVLALIAGAIAAVVSFLSTSTADLPTAFKTAMTQEHRWVTQEETTGGEWVAMIFQAFPALRPLLTIMSGVLGLLGVWFAYLFVKRAFGGGE